MENHHSVAPGIAGAHVVGEAQMCHQMGLVDAHGCVSVVTDVLVVMNVAAVVRHAQVVLKCNAAATASTGYWAPKDRMDRNARSEG